MQRRPSVRRWWKAKSSHAAMNGEHASNLLTFARIFKNLYVDLIVARTHHFILEFAFFIILPLEEAELLLTYSMPVMTDDLLIYTEAALKLHNCNNYKQQATVDLGLSVTINYVLIVVTFVSRPPGHGGVKQEVCREDILV